MKRSIPFCLICLIGFTAVSTAQQNHRLEPKIGFEANGFISGDDLTHELTDHRILPAGSAYIDIPIVANLSIYGVLSTGTSLNAAENIAELKQSKFDYKKFSYTTRYASATVGPAYAFPGIVSFVTPFVSLNAGVLSKQTQSYRDNSFVKDHWKSFLIYGFGVGFDFPLTKALDVRLMYRGYLTASDELDGLPLGTSRDGFSFISIGFSLNSLELGSLPSLPGEEFSRSTRGRSRDAADVLNRIRSLTLRTLPFSSFDELQENASRLMLHTTLSVDSPLPVKVECVFKRGEKEIARSTRQVAIDGKFDAMHALEFLDFDDMTVAAGFEHSLPEGTYEVYVTVTPPLQNRLECNGSFQYINFARHFGADSARIAELVRSGAASISLSKDNRIILRLTDAGDGNGGAAGEEYTTFAEHDEDGPQSRDFRTAVRLFPEHADSARMALIIDERTTGSFNRALTLIKAISTKRRTGAVIAVVYFDEGSSMLGDEGRMTLDNVARKFRVHPDLHFELRGFAGDHSDDVYNLRLSEQRADRVYDYLARKIVPTSVLSTEANGRSDVAPRTDGARLRSYRRVEIVLVRDEIDIPAEEHGLAQE